jgi:hypothetical protein
LVDLKAAGQRILIVGLPMAQRDLLEALHLIPDVMPEKDLFDDFLSLKAAMPTVLSEIEAMRLQAEQSLSGRPL